MVVSFLFGNDTAEHAFHALQSSEWLKKTVVNFIWIIWRCRVPHQTIETRYSVSHGARNERKWAMPSTVFWESTKRFCRNIILRQLCRIPAEISNFGQKNRQRAKGSRHRQKATQTEPFSTAVEHKLASLIVLKSESTITASVTQRSTRGSWKVLWPRPACVGIRCASSRPTQYEISSLSWLRVPCAIFLGHFSTGPGVFCSKFCQLVGFHPAKWKWRQGPKTRRLQTAPFVKDTFGCTSGAESKFTLWLENINTTDLKDEFFSFHTDTGCFAAIARANAK